MKLPANITIERKGECPILVYSACNTELLYDITPVTKINDILNVWSLTVYSLHRGYMQVQQVYNY